MPLLSAVVAVSGFTLAFALELAFYLAPLVLVTLPIGFATLGALLASLLPPSSLLPLSHSSAPFPRCHVPDPLGPFLPAPLPALYPFQAMAHTSSYDMSLLVSEAFCVVFVSCVPTFPVPSARPVVSHYLVHNDLQFLHNFIKRSRSRQEFPFDVFWHHLPRHAQPLSVTTL